ncbi:MAG: thymidylate synthase [Candidatus Methanomethylophilaceae archaeon]|nr:thymidylate synthase [Candidatus Methanomethylophilaceae archaeon]
MKVKLLAHTPDPDLLCAAAGQSCYSSKGASSILEKAEQEQAERVLGKIVGMGHHSVIEHASFTFSVEGVSRALTHQLVRHRIASFSQQSQRHVSLSEPSFITPHNISHDPKLHARYNALMEEIWNVYRELAESVPKEDARYVLPNACSTNITITMNARELRHFFTLRCCNRAQWEIREMADRMLELCKEVSPVIFKDAGPPCVRGPCPEGDLSCGNPRRL